MRRGAPLSQRTSSLTMVVDDDVEGGTALLRSPPSSSSGTLDISEKDSSPSKRTKRVSHAYLTKHSTDSLRMYAVIVAVVTGIVCPFLPIEICVLVLVFSSCTFGGIASLWLSTSVLQCDDGTPEMREVSNPIREGAEGFLHVQYTVRT